MTKKDLRNQIKAILKENSIFMPEASEKICTSIENSRFYKESKIILAYMALKDEVNLSNLLGKALADRKKVYIPKTDFLSCNMDFYEFQNQNTTKGAFGILEPEEKNLFNLNEFENTNINSDFPEILILVPGRAFSVKKDRLGRGKGYYDNYLSKLNKIRALEGRFTCKRKITFAGICFDCQLLKALPVEEHDIKMDIIITEKKFF